MLSAAYIAAVSITTPPMAWTWREACASALRDRLPGDATRATVHFLTTHQHEAILLHQLALVGILIA